MDEKQVFQEQVKRLSSAGNTAGDSKSDLLSQEQDLVNSVEQLYPGWWGRIESLSDQEQ